MALKILYKYKVVSDKTYQNLGEWKKDYNGGPTIPVEFGLTASQYLSFDTLEQTVTRELVFKSEEAYAAYNALPGAGWGKGDKTLVRKKIFL